MFDPEVILPRRLVVDTVDKARRRSSVAAKVVVSSCIGNASRLQGVNVDFAAVMFGELIEWTVVGCVERTRHGVSSNAWSAAFVIDVARALIRRARNTVSENGEREEPCDSGAFL